MDFDKAFSDFQQNGARDHANSRVSTGPRSNMV